MIYGRFSGWPLVGIFGNEAIHGYDGDETSLILRANAPSFGHLGTRLVAAALVPPSCCCDMAKISCGTMEAVNQSMFVVANAYPIHWEVMIFFGI